MVSPLNLVRCVTLKTKKMRNTLICTVGTSLFSNLKRLSIEADIENWEEIKTQFDNKNWSELSKELGKLSPDSRLCGAEINTIEEANKKNRNLFR